MHKINLYPDGITGFIAGLPLLAELVGGDVFLCDHQQIYASSCREDEPDKAQQEEQAVAHLLKVINGQIPPIQRKDNMVVAVLPVGEYFLIMNNAKRQQSAEEFYKIIKDSLPFIAQVVGGDATLFDAKGVREKACDPSGKDNVSAVGVFNHLCYRTMIEKRPSIGPSVMFPGATAVRIPLTDEYGLAINNNLATKQRQRLMDRAREYNYARYHMEDIIGSSTEMEKIKQLVMEAAKSYSTILLSGETGTGKELFAQAIHNASPRALQPFIAINCGALPSELVESTLFGYVDGAFTGAKRKGQIGAFEQANNGTLFLDEISEMPYELQVKLLRVLQEREIVRVGDAKPIPVDVRIVASTNKYLPDLVKEGKFRVDLYFRLNVIQINIPPLRERKNDILAFIELFSKKYASMLGKPIHDITPEVIEVLCLYDWPGNVREMQNCIEYIFNMVDVNDRSVRIEHLPAYILGKHNTIDDKICFFDEYMQKAEGYIVLKALKLCSYNKSETAKMLGLNRTTLWRIIKKHNLDSLRNE